MMIRLCIYVYISLIYKKVFFFMSRNLKENVRWVDLENKVNCVQDIRLIIIIETI